jgi:hypothetical protein
VLLAAAVCPHPPLLVPGVASGATPETADLRAAAAAAVHRLVAAQPDLVVVVGAAPGMGPCDPQARGNLAPYGVDVQVGAGTGEASLSLALTIGLWLLESHAPDVPRLLFGVHPETEAARCASLGAGIAERAPRVALLVMGDGSARRSLKGPGYLDDRAEGFDSDVSAALADVEPQRLLDLDVALSEELLVAGRAAWQVLAGAAQAREAAGEPALSGDVGYAAAPYGVCYLVATWLPTAG